MKTALKELVTLRRGNSYQGALVGEVGAPLLGLGTIARGGGFKGDKLRHYPEEFADRIAVAAGDVYVSLKDMTQEAALLGAAARVPEGIERARLTQDTIAVDVIENAPLSKAFLYWTLRSPQCRDYCKSLGTGTTNLDLSRADFLAYEMWLPTLREQQIITEVLDSLDDKIAANRRVAACSRELQQAVWERYRGEIPLIPLVELATPRLGGTPKRADPALWGGGIPWASVRDMSNADFGVILSTVETINKLPNQPERLRPVPAGSTYLTARGTVGKVATAGVDCAFNQSAYAFVPSPGRSAALRLAVQGAVTDLVARAHGSVFSTITTTTLSGSRVPNIDDSSADRLAEEVEWLEQRLVAALQENQLLARTRDELLPLLMSGKITVKDAERAAEDVL